MPCCIFSRAESRLPQRGDSYSRKASRPLDVAPPQGGGGVAAEQLLCGVATGAKRGCVCPSCGLEEGFD